VSWKMIKLAEVCEIKLGKTPSRSDKSYWDDEKSGSNIWVSIADLTKLNTRLISDSKEYITDKGAALFQPVKAGTLLMSFKLSIGKLAYANCDLYTNEAIVALPIKDKSILDSDFLYYFLQFYDWDKETENDVKLKGKTLNKAKLKEIKLPLPPLSTQQKIVSKLDAIFSEIDKATAAAEANAKNSEALFKSYLNQFFESRSEGWTEKPLPSLCTLFNGRAYSKNELLDSGKYTVLRVGNFFTNEHWYYSDLELEDNKYCDNGDLLYAWSASFGPRIWGGDKVIYHYHIWKVVPNPAVIDKMFLFYLLEWDVDKIKRDHGTGATMIHVSKKSMESRVLPYFDLDSQKEIVLRLQAMKNHTNSLKRQYDDKLRAIVSYKESILRKAFSGELVKE
jgi:type I restriction enzyme S subunit